MNEVCTYCSADSIFHRKYSGENLCPDCFIESIEKKIYNTISKYKLLSPKDNIVVGLSGGKDSISLLYNIIQIQKRTYNANPIKALSVDEGIKNHREKSIKIARDFCRRHDIEHQVISFKNEIGMNLDEIISKNTQKDIFTYACNYCAVFRRRLLNDYSKRLGATVLILGHNLTDLAETFLMNVLHKRTKKIANQNLKSEFEADIYKYYVRRAFPLMKIPEDEISLYARLKNFDFYSELCPYRVSQPILRKRCLQFIEDCRKYSPEIEFNLFNAFSEISDVLYTHYKGKMDISHCTSCGYPSGTSLKCQYCARLEEIKR